MKKESEQEKFYGTLNAIGKIILWIIIGIIGLSILGGIFSYFGFLQ